MICSAGVVCVLLWMSLDGGNGLLTVSTIWRITLEVPCTYVAEAIFILQSLLCNQQAAISQQQKIILIPFYLQLRHS